MSPYVSLIRQVLAAVGRIGRPPACVLRENELDALAPQRRRTLQELRRSQRNHDPLHALEGDGECTVVLINGLADDMDAWAFQVEPLLSAGMRVLRFVSPSPAPTPHPIPTPSDFSTYGLNSPQPDAT
jgi:hypothetical protein